MKLEKVVELSSGYPQFRIVESKDREAPTYTFFSQNNLSEDLIGIPSDDLNQKQIRTKDEVSLLRAGDAVFSLISGKAAIISNAHEGYLYTQNYVKLIPGEAIDLKFLVYILNESRYIEKQFLRGLQGSAVMKYTLKQLKEIDLSNIPPLEKQKIIGDTYLKQLRLQALKKKVIDLETDLLLCKLEEEISNGRESV